MTRSPITTLRRSAPVTAGLLSAVVLAAAPVGCQNLVVVFDLRRYAWTGGRHAARSYSWISPPRTLRRRIRTAVESVTGAVMPSSWSGGRRFLARCGGT